MVGLGRSALATVTKTMIGERSASEGFIRTSQPDRADLDKLQNHLELLVPSPSYNALGGFLLTFGAFQLVCSKTSGPKSVNF